MEVKKTYKYIYKETGKELEAVLVKKKDRCYLYLDKSINTPSASFDLDRYNNFNFYYVLECFINPDAMNYFTRDEIIEYLKETNL